LPDSFSERLKFLIKTSSYSASYVAKKTSIRYQRILCWCSGENYPSLKSYESIIKLERFFGLDKGTLTETVKYWHGDGSHNQNGEFQTTYAELQSKRGKSKYAFKFELWPEKLKVQWRGIESHHTARIKPALPRNKYAFWRKPSTVIKRRYLFELFFGFLISPKEQGGLELNIDELDFRLLAVVEDDGRIRFVEKYLDFHLNRTICYEYPQGVYSKSLKSDLKILCCFFHSKYGYFVHSPDFNSDDKHWKITCGKVMERLIDLKQSYFVQIRKPKEKADFILQDPHPCRFLNILVKNLEKALPSEIKRPVSRRIYNWYFVCSFLSAIPLRSSMLCNMQLDKNLYFKDDSWRVRFDSIEFKNDDGAAKDRDYDVICPDWLNPIIDKYLSVRKFYPGGGTTNGIRDCEYVIRPSTNNGVRTGDIFPIRTNTIFRYCVNATSKFIPNCKGFGPHTFRHIIATDWIKNHPEGYKIAAEILHDRIETVLKNYSHLETSDWLKHYNDHSNKNFGPEEEKDPED
jgi:integrase